MTTLNRRNLIVGSAHLPTVIAIGQTALAESPAPQVQGPLAEAGVSGPDIAQVVITHRHPDLISGMTRCDGGLAYPNAAYGTDAIEFDTNAHDKNEVFETKVRPFVEQFAFLNDDDTVASGVTATADFGHTTGHTTGHMIYRLESDGCPPHGAGHAGHRQDPDDRLPHAVSRRWVCRNARLRLPVCSGQLPVDERKPRQTEFTFDGAVPLAHAHQ